MPNNNAWNHQWTGAGNYYAVVKSFPAKHSHLENVLKRRYHYYNFGDGWGASVCVNEVDSKSAQSAKRKTKGFCGYDWMVDEICTLGRIKARDERIIRGTP